MSRVRWKSCGLGLPEMPAGTTSNISPWSSKPASFWILLFLSLSSLALVVYAAVFSSAGQLFPWTTACPASAVRSADVDHAPGPSSGSGMDPSVATSISHILFGIAGSAKTWHKRRAYSQLWWRPGVTRGYVWLDKEPELPQGGDVGVGVGGGNSSSSNSVCPPSCPPYRISADASRFGPRVSAARIARILTESYRLVSTSNGSDGDEIRWLVMGDDDTVFFPDNLVSVLGKYDHRQAYYVGGHSESVEQDVMHSYGMAFGGGGFAVSLPLAAELAGIFDRCLVRYARFYGSDQRVQGCMSELGVPLTREPGFHQLDIRGDPFGLLAAHPLAPLVSLHHLDYVKPIFPGLPTQLDAVRKLVDASQSDPAGTLQQSICYEQRLNWSVSVSWGYAAMVYPRVVPPRELEVPLQTFQTWRSFQNGPFTFNTRPLVPPGGSCDSPLVYFLGKPPRATEAAAGGGGDGGLKDVTTTTEYVVGVQGDKDIGGRRKACGDRAAFLSASKVSTVRVVAPRMDPEGWKRVASRRRCCEVKRSWWGNRLDVRIRKCSRGENMSPPD